MTDIWDMQFVHESTLSSGNQTPRCPFWIIWRWNFDFTSMGAKHLYDVTFNDWSNDCSPRIVAQALDSGCAFSTHWDGISKTAVLVRFGLVAHTSRYPVPERCEFANLFDLNILGELFEVLNVFPPSVSRCWSWRRHKRAFFLVPSRPLSSRIAHTNSKLLHGYRADLQNE